MKKQYFLLIALLAVGVAHGQYSINFDNFTTGDVSVQSSHIITWPAPEATDAQVSNAYANSAPHSMMIRPAGSTIADDVLFQLGDKDAGIWVLEWMLYMPSGATGYWNLQENESASPAQWNGEFFIGATASGGSAGMVTHDQTGSTAAYPSDTWFPVMVTVDLDALQISVTVNGNTLLQNAAYSGVVSGSSVAASQLGGLDFFSVDANTTIYVDDFRIHEICYPPSGLSVDALTDTSADVSWTAASNETGGYSWGLMADGDHPSTGSPLQSGTTPTTVTSVALTGLTAYTEYDFYVFSNCDPSIGVSVWIGALEFKTNAQCGISGSVTTFPFTAGFELSSTTLGCWTQIKEEGDGSWIFATGSSSGSVTTAYSGTHNARFVSTVGEDSPVTKLVSPVFDLTGLANPELSFYYAQEVYAGDQNKLKVYYRESDADAWVELANYTSSVTAWTEERIALPNPTATYQIAFEGINNYGHANVIDEVRIGEVLSVGAYVFESLEFYPNPVKNELFLNSKQVIDRVVVRSLLGKKVLSVEMSLPKVKLNTSNLPSGMYLMQVFVGDNSKAYKLLKD